MSTTLMKSIHSLIRSFRVVPLLFTTALWSLPSSGRAQLYISQDTTVGKYDAATGATINANFITGLNAPRGLALSGGNLYAANQSGTTIGKYDASTGAAINASFITVNNPRSLVVSGGTLFVTSGDLGGVVGKYDATTGATISAGFITGLTEPVGIAVSGSYLFVTDNNLDTVGKYDAATGAAINANFITGLSAPVGIFVSGNNLFVANAGGNTVGKYDATSGAAINANFITGLATPAGIWVMDNTLFVSNNSGNKVGKYDATTGAAMNANFITGLTNPAFLVVAPSGTSPIVTTGSATGATTTSATLNGTVNPNGLASTAQFEYGLTTAYGNTASVTLSPNNGTTAQNVSAVVSGLTSGQTYHFRLKAINAATEPNWVYGNDLSFSTSLAGLADAIDLPAATVTSGGGAPWFAQTTTTRDGVDASQSGAITHSQESWMQSTLTGPVTLTFWWKVSSESDYDFLEFYLDGVLQSGSISGTVDWELKSYSIAAGAHIVKWRYMKDGSASSGSDCGWVDQVNISTPSPSVTTASATAVTATSATLNGTVNPNGSATTAQFEYGLTTAYGSTASVTLSPNNGTTAQNVSAVVSGLQGGRTYHYRLTATNAGGTMPGSDQTFTTSIPPVGPEELVAPRVEIVGDNAQFTVGSTIFGRRYQLQQSDTMAPGTWVNAGTEYTGDGNALVIPIPHEPGVPKRFYRLALDSVGGVQVPEGFVLIPAGEFLMGDQSNPPVGNPNELPVHTVYVSAFYMAKYEVTKELWDEVRAWGLNNGYTDLAVGNGSHASKGVNHPVHTIIWYDMVKWCNARSQMEGLVPCYTVAGEVRNAGEIYKTGLNDPDCNWNANGYRLPTEAEWEKAARGTLNGKNFPWGDTITHSQANYYSYSSKTYDVSPTRGYHPTYAVGGTPYSSPVGSFPANGYGLYDMAGNLWEWCWDWYGSYPSTSQADPRGPAPSTYLRVLRGGDWYNDAFFCRVANRHYNDPSYTYNSAFFGFRLARSSVP